MPTLNVHFSTVDLQGEGKLIQRQIRETLNNNLFLRLSTHIVQ